MVAVLCPAQDKYRINIVMPSEPGKSELAAAVLCPAQDLSILNSSEFKIHCIS